MIPYNLRSFMLAAYLYASLHYEDQWLMWLFSGEVHYSTEEDYI